MSKRAQPSKKTVAFASSVSMIDAPGDSGALEVAAKAAASPSRQGKGQFRQQVVDVYVAKAKEFESFKQMPKFSHPLGAVIHPSPSKIDRAPAHRPPGTLQFDGLPA